MILLFQFHTGSIKRRCCRSKINNCQCFNSTLVRLKDGFGSTPNQAKIRFNSTLVRLKAIEAAGGRAGRELFQFHTGSIKRRRRESG